MVKPGKRQMELGEQRRHQNGKAAKRHGDPRRQGRGRHRDRRDEQEGEGILQAAGQVEQRAELEDVVAEHQKGVVALETLACRVAEAERDVEPCRERDHRKTGADRQIDAHDPIDAR